MQLFEKTANQVIECLWLLMEVLLRLVAQLGTLALLVGLVLMNTDGLLEMPIFTGWRWFPLVWSLVLMMSLDANLLVLIMDAVLDRVPADLGDRVRAWRRGQQIGRLIVVGILGCIVGGSIVLAGQSPAAPDWILTLRNLAALVVVIFNLAFVPFVRSRVASELAASQRLVLAHLRAHAPGEEG